MTKSEFLKLKFKERYDITRGDACDATWQVETSYDSLYHVSCRVCGTQVQPGCVPKCLKNIKAENHEQRN